MIITLLLAMQAVQPDGFTPSEARAVTATMVCQMNFFDSAPRRERRRRGNALLEQSHRECAAEEAALRLTLRSRFNERNTEQVMQVVRGSVREQMLRYIRDGRRQSRGRVLPVSSPLP